MSCPDEATLAGAVNGGLTSELEAHLDGCAACRHVLAAAVGEGAPATIGRYELGPVLGVGGMGVVYAARDPRLGRTVALKLLRADDASARARFLREAQVMAQLSHPAVVSVFDVGELERRVFLAMEHMPGGTLRQWLTRGPTLPERLALLRQAGAGLAAAHRVGVVHRDFKPENVLLDGEGRARVTDFGLARWDDGALPDGVETLTRTVGFAGTPAYMAPEQLRGELADARSDQYSFCVVAYEVLEGRRPREGRTVGELRSAHRVPPPTRTDVPASIWRAILRGLSERPEARFESMEALLAALDPRPRRWPQLLVAALVVPTSLAALVLARTDGASVEPGSVPAVQPTPAPEPKKKQLETDVLVEPGAAEPLPRAGTPIFLEPEVPRTFAAAGLRRARIAAPEVLDAEGTEVELTLSGLRPGTTELTLEFDGAPASRWPVVVRAPVSMPPEPRTLAVGETFEVAFPLLTRVSIGDAKIVEVERIAGGLRFRARASGATNALLWTSDARRFELVFRVESADAGVLELEVGLQRVLTVERIVAVEVEPSGLCEATPLGSYEVLLTPLRSGAGWLRLRTAQGDELRALRVSERR